MERETVRGDGKDNQMKREYLTTVTDPKLKKALTMYSEHSPAIEKGRRNADMALKRRQAMCTLPTK